MLEKKLNCDAVVLKELQRKNIEVRNKKGEKIKIVGVQVRNKNGDTVKINDAHVTGCRVYTDPMDEKKKLYSVTTLDGKHHRGPMPKE